MDILDVIYFFLVIYATIITFVAIQIRIELDLAHRDNSNAREQCARLVTLQKNCAEALTKAASDDND